MATLEQLKAEQDRRKASKEAKLPAAGKGAGVKGETSTAKTAATPVEKTVPPTTKAADPKESEKKEPEKKPASATTSSTPPKK